MMAEVHIEALRDPFEKLITYIDLCETCMYGYPNDLWGNQSARTLRESYMKSAQGAIDFIVMCYPELRTNDSIMDYLESRISDMQKIVDSYYTREDKKKMHVKPYDELCAAMRNKT